MAGVRRGRPLSPRARRITGWIAVGVSTAIGCLWAFWGAIENFHEGWYDRSLLRNLAVAFAQYYAPAALFVVPALLAIRWPRAGGLLHGAMAGGAIWFFRGASPMVIYPFIAAPLVLMGALYWAGRPEPRRWALRIAVGLPLLTLLGFSVEPAIRVAGRVDDGDRSARRVAGNDVDLVWAPEGPGWPKSGVRWEEARRLCAHLAGDGTAVLDAPQGIWRLPTVEEAVRSQHRHGTNAGGTWDPVGQRARYRTMPDKETPLWDRHSQVVYWWTATEDPADTSSAFIVVYNGQVRPRVKRAHWGYLGFRAVRDVSR